MRELGMRGALTHAPSADARAQWAEQGHAFLQVAAGIELEETKASQASQKVQRGKAKQFLQCLEHGLKTSVGVGLAHFVPKPLAATSVLNINQPHCLNVLSLSIDQGSSGWAASWYLLLHTKAALVVHNDPSHRCHNDLHLAYRACGLWDHIVVTSILYNFSYGPFLGAGWLEQGRTAAEEFASLAGPEDELFQTYLDAIASDLGLAACSGDDDYASLVFTHFKEAACWTKKGPQVKLSRWMSWLCAAQFHDQFWTTRLVAFIYWGICHGWALKGKGRAPLISPLRSSTSTAKDEPKVPVPQGDQEAAALRRKCTNTMHLCAWLLSDPAIQVRSRMCFKLSAPTQQWHGNQNQQCRSPDACLDLACRWAQGLGWMESLAATVQLLQDPATLDSCGITTNFGQASLKQFDVEHPVVKDQDGLAQQFATLATNILRFRCRGMLFNWSCYPGLLAKLAGSPEVQRDTLRTMEADWKAWKAASAHAAHDAWWRRRLERSCFQQVVVQYAFKLAASAGFAYVPPALASLVDDSFKSIGQTKLIEDTFHDQRDAETRGQSSKAMSAPRKFQICVASEVLEKTHNFQTISHKDYTLPLDGATFSPALCKPDKVRQCSIDLNPITGSLSWHSPTALSAQAVAADLQLMRACSASDQWDLGSASWRAAVVPEGVVMKHRSWHHWMLSLSHVQGVAVLLWPLDPVQVVSGQPLSFTPGAATVSQLAWAVILDWEDWVALPCRWSSPLSAWKLNGHRRLPLTAIVCASVGEEVPLLRHCARQGFFRTDLVNLNKLVVDLGVGTSHKDLANVMLALVRHLLPDISDEDLLSILQKRLPKASEYLDILESEEVSHELDEEDREACAKMRKQEDEKQGAASALKVEIRALHAKIRAKRATSQVPGSSAASSSSQASKKRKTATKAVKQVPPAPEDLSEEQARDLMPPDARLYKDYSNNRWRGYYLEQSRSRSWAVRSARDCCLEVLQFLWTCHKEHTGEACEIKGLFST